MHAAFNKQKFKQYKISKDVLTSQDTSASILIDEVRQEDCLSEEQDI
jgi:hypothetical protein